MCRLCVKASHTNFAISPTKIAGAGGEEPKDPRISKAISGFLEDSGRSVDRLQNGVFDAIDLPVQQAANKLLKMSPAQELRLNKAIDQFIEEMVGRDMSRLGFVSPQSADGLVQQWDRFAYSIGVQRSSEIVGADAARILPSRNSEGVRQMLDNAFTRLSENGELRLVKVRDDIQGILASGMDAGMSPIDVARGLSGQFDQYKGWEFERLARTEVAFAQNQGQFDEFTASGFTSAIGETPPFHPHCFCAITIDPERKAIVYDIAGSACEICQAYVGTESFSARPLTRGEVEYLYRDGLITLSERTAMAAAGGRKLCRMTSSK